MSDTPQETREPPQPTPATTQADQPARSPAMPRPPQMPGRPPLSAAERVRLAAQRRGESDYIFSYWSALGWTILTLGIYGFYVFYQLVRRMRDHNARRLELLDQDLIKHGQAEAGAEHELSVIYGQMGQRLSSPDRDRLKRPDNYVGRILATIFSFGIYMFWWYYNQMEEPNKHFADNWAQEDELVKAVDALS
jgi:hypothetical protein